MAGMADCCQTTLTLTILLMCTAACQCLVHNGVKVKPKDYSMQDGPTWASPNRTRYSDSSYSGSRNQSGYLSGGTGRLVDGIIAEDTSNRAVWVRWHTGQLEFIFDFKQNTSFCQVDAFVRTKFISDVTIKVYYAENMRRYWGEGTSLHSTSSTHKFTIPRRNISGIDVGRSTARLYVVFEMQYLPEYIDVSEFTFWECPCPAGTYAAACPVRSTFSSVVAPCDDENNPPCADSRAVCFNDYCAAQRGGGCQPLYLRPQTSELADCSTVPTTSAVPTTTAMPTRHVPSVSQATTPSPVQRKSSSDETVIYLGVIGGLAAVAIVAIILLCIRCYHYRRAKRRLKITTATIMAEGRYSAATLSRHFVNFNTTASNGQLSTSLSNGSRVGTPNTSNGGPSAHYKIPRMTASGEAISIDQYKSPPRVTNTATTAAAASSSSSARADSSADNHFTGATNSPRSSDDPEEYVPMTGVTASAQPPPSPGYEVMDLALGNGHKHTSAKAAEETDGKTDGGQAGEERSPSAVDPVVRRLEFGDNV